jgi:PhnB protein
LPTGGEVSQSAGTGWGRVSRRTSHVRHFLKEKEKSAVENRKRQSIIPSLTVNNAENAIAFYEKALGAKVDGKIMRGPDGKIMHAELLFGDMRIFLNDECPEMGAHSPKHFGGTSVSLYLTVADADQTYNAAMAAGATSKMAPQDAFWGDRYAFINDPFGHGWGLATPKEQLTPEQIVERAREMFKQPAHK